MRNYLAALLVLLALPALAQKQGKELADSFQQEVNKHINDTISVKCLVELAGLSLNESPSTAEKYCRLANEVALKMQFRRGLVDSYGWIAYLMEQKGQIDSALHYYFAAIDIARQSNFKKDLGTCYNNVAAIYKDQGKIAEALDYHEKSLAIRKELNDKDGIATSYNNLGLLYYNLGQVQEALNYYNRSLKIAEEINNSESITTALYNIASVYKDQGHFPEALEYVERCLALQIKEKDKYNIAYATNYKGLIYEKQGLYSAAMAQYLEALKIRRDIQDKQGVAYSLRNIGGLYELMDSTQQTLANYLQSLDYMQQAEDKAGIANVQYRLGKYYLRHNDLTAAVRYGSAAMKTAAELQFPENLRDAAELMNKVYRLQKNWSQALTMNDLYIKMRDSILNTETKKAAYKDRFAYEYGKKELTLKKEQEKKDALSLAQLQRQKLLRNASFAGFALVMLLLGNVYNRYREKSKANIVITQEKQRSDELLKNILPIEVAEELKAKGSSDARLFDEVTVLFTDFVNFTRISERLSPSQLVHELDNCFKAIDGIVSKYGIEKIKTVGDAYLAVAGLPVENPNHAEHMVLAAIEIRDYMIARKAELGDETFGIRIGIHSGSVVAGIVGVKKFAYDIWGDTVNTAARMEQNSAEGRINISGATYQLIKDKFQFEYRGKVEAKNKGELDMYFVA